MLMRLNWLQLVALPVDQSIKEGTWLQQRAVHFICTMYIISISSVLHWSIVRIGNKVMMDFVLK